MLNGMLWFDKTPDRTLAAKIAGAADYYHHKYGIRPTVCFVHPAMLLGEQVACEGITIVESNQVLPHHFWLGIEPEEL